VDTQGPGVELDHPVSGGHKYRDLIHHQSVFWRKAYSLYLQKQLLSRDLKRYKPDGMRIVSLDGYS